MGKSDGVLYLDRNSLWIFISSSQNIFKFVFQPGIIKDFEIVSKEDLQKQLTFFIESNKFPPARMVLILSDASIFEKNLPLMNETERVVQIQNYIDNVPFEDVGIKLLPFEKGVRILATNRTLYETLKDIFEKKGINIEGVIPALIVSREVHFANGLDARSAHYLIGKIDTLKQYSFPINSQALINKTEQKPGQLHEKPKNNSLIFLTAIFVLLLVVMGYMVYQNFYAPPTPVLPQAPVEIPQNVKSAPTEIPTIPPSNTPQSSSPSATFDKTTLKITIISSGDPVQTDKLRQEMIKIGYKNVIINITGNSVSRTQIVVPSLMPGELKSELAAQVAALFPNPTVIENNTVKDEITITLGKP